MTKRHVVLYVFTVLCLLAGSLAYAQIKYENSNYNAPDLLAKSEIFITPRTGSFLVGSTFESQIYIDTKGASINAINLKIKYDPGKISLITPSGGKSIFGIWVEPPYYDNKNGTAGMAGIITDGITTSSGLIVTMTFKVLAAGPTTISITDQTSANLNDGYGSEVLLNRGRANYFLNNKPPEGVMVYSETHQSNDVWYSNKNPIFTWEPKQPAEGYSVLFDTVLQSTPDTVITHIDANAAYADVGDGIWYLHVRPVSKKIWGSTTHFITRIDTKPPAEFKPTVSKIKDSNNIEKYLISFFTTDALSGLEHYEVGLVSKDDIDKTSPIFTQTESPYVLSLESGANSRIIVRAYDKAGNVQEEFIDIYPGVVFVQLLKKIGIYVLFIIIFLLLLELILHYLFGHHILDRIKRGYQIAKNITFKESDEKTIHMASVPPVTNTTPLIVPSKIVESVPTTPVNSPVVGSTQKPIETTPALIPKAPEASAPIVPLVEIPEHFTDQSNGQAGTF